MQDSVPRLKERLARIRAQAAALEAEREVLRLRLVALSVVARAMDEVVAHLRVMRLAELVRHAPALAPTAAPAPAAAARSTCAGPQSSCGLACATLGWCGVDGGNQGFVALGPGSALSDAAQGGAATCSNVRGVIGGGGSPLSCAEAPPPSRGPVSSLGSAESALDAVWDRLPHLAPGRSLLNLESVTLEQVKEVRAMDAAQARLMFQSCLEPALRDINRAASPDQAARAPCTPGLGAVGRRLGSFLGLLAIWNADAYAGLMGGHLLTGRPAAGMEDARLPHWERCVRGAGLTRVQLHASTCGLPAVSPAASLASPAASVASASASASVSAGAARSNGPGDPDYWLQGPHASQPPHEAPPRMAQPPAALAAGAPWLRLTESTPAAEALAEALAESSRCESTAMMMMMQASRAVMHPAQLAKCMAFAFPWPLHDAECWRVLAHTMKFTPEVFPDRIKFSAPQDNCFRPRKG
ncbi:hypothetical protein MNEG_0194 [Monoraphidium neglectum]|uniref:Uncharacterized protein n=1 Tax=Monoraphidium neglectum TaxID=145388 RepID=A0A0D2LNA7_9CHLO|nr:hypothetical protein MNEG_0194 [Monoraphidium neglectum]KIZ07749.1 hypothetical protein MNEG_0194 [Monoraphidium neglectum]|eukprot:XP_013906768.1 hypothetical protein MNEG_0194 [Monoraphidium neglectum]